jgi:hypothetical protein
MKPITYGLDYESRPQWGIVNPQILASFYAMINSYSLWKKKKMMGAGEKIIEYYEFHQYLTETYLKVKAQFDEEKSDDLKKINEILEGYVRGKRTLTVSEMEDCMIALIKFLKMIGLTKIEVESARKFSLLGSE